MARALGGYAVTLALGRRQLAAHPSYYSTGGLTCASAYAARHVHVVGDDRPHLYMPDGCAACGRQWFAEDEETIMGYCGDCWPGSAILLDYSDGTEVVAATYPQPVRHRGDEQAATARGRATVGGECVACAAMQIKYNQLTAACPAHRKPTYPDVAPIFDHLVDQGWNGNPFAPFGPRPER